MRLFIFIISCDFTLYFYFRIVNKLLEPARWTVSTIIYFKAIGMALLRIIKKLIIEGLIKPFIWLFV